MKKYLKQFGNTITKLLVPITQTFYCSIIYEKIVSNLAI